MPTSEKCVNETLGRPIEGGLEITDIRGKEIEGSLKDQIVSGLKKEGEKSLPTLLLYDERGLKLFEEITYSEDYYLTNTEIGVLEKYAESIADRIADDSIVVELGSGNLRKVIILLHALDLTGKKITYYALDLAHSELVRTLAEVPDGTFRNIRCVGLHGTYEDGRAWLRDSPTVKGKSRCILWLGSSAGNSSLPEVAEFLKGFAEDTLRVGTNDCMIIGLDGCRVGSKVGRAYNDSKGLTEKFILNGLEQANLVLGGNYFLQGAWEYISEWNAGEGRHQAYYKSLEGVDFSRHHDLRGVRVRRGERIHIEYSYKFDDLESRDLWARAGLMEGAQWSNTAGDYYIYMLYKPSFVFGEGLPANYASEPVPSLKEWKELWKAWDLVTRGMIPENKLQSRPIDLRNPCIFYLGHIPTFLDYYLLQATGGELTPQGQKYQRIFQRGIDPDVDNPEHCHAHSAIPDTWPHVDEILEFTVDIRNKTAALYDDTGRLKSTIPRVPRALWLAFEHEAMHLETLLYMLLQSGYTLPPPGVTKPDFVSRRAREERGISGDNSWLEVPRTMIDVGMDDPEELENNIPRYFGWDNEKPVRRGIQVSPFKVRSYPITNGEYAEYLRADPTAPIPASWELPTSQISDGNSRNAQTINGGNGRQMQSPEFMDSISVKTVFGPIPLDLALDWPVMASYDELSGCVEWMGGRIPSANELKAVYQHLEKREAIEEGLARRNDAVNGHLINNGVRESPPPPSSEGSGQQRESLFQDLRGLNVGFQNWHPTSVRSGGIAKLNGRCGMGGAWEWTSTVLEKHEGFKPGDLYPEYTADFFDGKHNIIMGGSWATHPRIAGRKSYVNWYQRNYRYTWCTARIISGRE